MRSILLKFAGPMQSWGTDSHFEKRHTDPYPSKSAVLGLIAASLGYRRSDEKRIQHLNELHFAVREDQPGVVFRDYHTAHSYKSNGNPARTYVTERYYIEDAVFVAAVGSESSDWISEIEEAIKHPYYQPYLGRRSLPLTADSFLGVTNTDVLTALREVPWQAAGWYKKRNADVKHIVIHADGDLFQGVPVRWRKDKVLSYSDSGRKYELRGEVSTQIDLTRNDSIVDSEHDAFGALGD